VESELSIFLGARVGSRFCQKTGAGVESFIYLFHENNNGFYCFHSFSIGDKQELEFNVFAKIGAGVKFFGVGVESESKKLDSDQIWS